MNRVLLIIGGLFVGLLAALFTVPVFVDWNRYRGAFEEEASRLLGREVRVGGKVNLRLLPTPYIRFEKVRIADTRATVGEPLFRADDFTVWLAVAPLFSGGFEASEIELRKPVLTLVLDDKGGGNWASLAEPGSQSIFRPSWVALDAVRITNGSIAIFGSGGNERTRFEHINGELTAAALEGPYRFTAAFSSQGLPRELRLSTAKPEADGSVRFKGTLRAPETGASYTLDGQAMDIFQQVRVQGELTAQLPLPKVPGGQKEAAPRAAAAEAAFELKALLKADAAGVDLADIALSFEQDGRPQLAAGLARISWKDRLSTRLDLQSRWLDLDRITGRGTDTTVSGLAQRFVDAIASGMPDLGETTVKLDLDQATLGGEIVSGLGLQIDRNDALLKIQLAVQLPGSSRLQAIGTLAPGRPDATFDGDISLRGASLARLAQWVGKPAAMPALARDGAFTLTGRMTLGAERLAGRNLVVQFAGNSVTGEASWSATGGKRQIALALDGAELDVSPLVEPNARPVEVLKALTAFLSSSATRAITAAAPTSPPDVTARLRIGRLVSGPTVLRDVVADVRAIGGNLTLPMLRLGSDDGWSAELRGDIAGLLKPDAKGNLALSITAETPAALQSLAVFLDIGEAMRPSARRAGTMVPLRLAGRLRLGETAAGVHDLALDGMLGPSRLSGTLRLEPKGESWRDTRTDVALALDGGDTSQLVAQVLPDGFAGLGDAATRVPGRIVMRGIGTPKSGLVSLVGLDLTGITSEFRGRLALGDAAIPAADGELRFAIADLGHLITLAGGRERAGFAGKPASGLILLSSSGGKLSLEASRIALAGTDIAGRVELQSLATGTRLTGRIALQELSLPDILALATIARPGGRIAGAAPVWSEDAFDLSALGNLVGQLRIEARQLLLAPGVALAVTAIDAEFKPGRVDFKLTEAATLGGKFAAALAIERAAVGARVSGSARLTGGRLDSYTTSAGKEQLPAASGPLGFQIEVDGTALSPRGLIAALRGKGELKVGPGQLNRLSPSAVGAAAEAILAIKGEIPPGDLKSRLEQLLATGTVAVGLHALPIEIIDGIVKIQPLILDAPDGRLTGTTVLDLESLRFDSEWRMEPKPPVSAPTTGANAQPRRTLPAATLVYTGPLAKLGQTAPLIQSEALEREIALRKLERDADELERLRRLDAERVRLESERQRQLEIERLQREHDRRAAAQSEPGSPLTVPAGTAAATPVPPTVPAAAATGGLPLPSALQLQPPPTGAATWTGQPTTLVEPNPAHPADADKGPSPETAVLPRAGTDPAQPAPARAPPAPRPATRSNVFRDLDRSSSLTLGAANGNARLQKTPVIRAARQDEPRARIRRRPRSRGATD